MPRQTNSRMSDHVLKEKLMSKLLTRIVADLQSRKVQPTPELMDEAHRMLQENFESHKSMSDKDLHVIVTTLVKKRKSAPQSSATPATTTEQSVPQQRSETPAQSETSMAREVAERSLTPTESAMDSVKRARELLKNTSRKQRQILADANWAQLAEEDRVAGIEGKKNDRRQQVNLMSKQRQILDNQIEEHQRQAELDRQQRLRVQDEMTEHIKNHQYLSRKERQDAFNKAQREKKFREDQQKEVDRLREQARNDEHNDQVRHAMMVRQELEKQRQADLDQKNREKSEWKRMVQTNNDRLEDRARTKDKQAEEDRLFQKEYSDRLDKQERDRAEAKARKQARATYFQQLADGVAKMFMAKEEDLGNKIETEYEEQLRRTLEDEHKRKMRKHERTLDCQQAIKDQLTAKKRQDEQDKEDARRLAEHMRQQAQEAQHQEQCRKMAARAEAQRLKEFLNTQLQMSHFKETQEPQTSITRPDSRCKTMYSPSRYTPSPKPDMMLQMDGRKLK